MCHQDLQAKNEMMKFKRQSLPAPRSRSSDLIKPVTGEKTAAPSSNLVVMLDT